MHLAGTAAAIAGAEEEHPDRRNRALRILIAGRPGSEPGPGGGVPSGGMCANTVEPSMPAQTKDRWGKSLCSFHANLMVRNESMPASRRIWGRAPVYPKASGSQHIDTR